MGKFARTFQPGLALALVTQRELFFDSLRNKLAQRNSQRTGGGLGLAKGWVWDLQSGLHDASIPYLWEQSFGAQEGRSVDRLAPQIGHVSNFCNLSASARSTAIPFAPTVCTQTGHAYPVWVPSRCSFRTPRA